MHFNEPETGAALRGRRFLALVFVCFLFILPFLRGGWDLWAQTLVHGLTALLLLAFLVLNQKEGRPFWGLSFVQAAALLWLTADFASFLLSRFPHSAGPGLLNDLTAVIFFFLAGHLAARESSFTRLLPMAIAGSLVVLNTATIVLHLGGMGSAGNQVLINPGVLAAYNALALPSVFRLATDSSARNFLWKAGCLVSLGALVLTRSTSVAVVLAGQSIAWALLRPGKLSKTQRWLVIAATVLAGIAVGVSFFYTWKDVLAVQRWHWNLSALRMFTANPALGVGPGAFGEAFPGYRDSLITVQNTLYSHNFLTEMLAERGIVGLVFFLNLLFFVAVSWRAAFHSEGDRSPDFALGLGLAGFLFFNLANFGLSIPSAAWMFWATAGFLSRSRDLPSDSTIPLRTRPRLAQTIVLLATVFLFVQSFRLFRSDQFLAQARYAATEENWDAVELLSARALRWNRASPEAYSWEAASLAQRDSLPAAVATCEQAIRLSRFTPRFHLEKAEYLRTEERTEEALAHYRLATKYNPLDSGAWLRRGELASAIGNLDDAHTSYLQAIEVNDILYRRLGRETPEHRYIRAEADRRLQKLGVKSEQK